MIILLLIYPSYKGVREMFWVKNSNYTIDNRIKIEVRIDKDILNFQDFNNEKTLAITNTDTKTKMKISFISLESNLYFYIDSGNSKKTLSIVDKFAGKNVYDYLTLNLVSETNCLKRDGGCGGFNDSSFDKLGLPYLTYDENGFHK